MRIAITGATGSLGGALIAALAGMDGITRIVSISRDEVKSGDLAGRWSNLAPLKCVLADVRDRERLEEALYGCDTVIHAAALKRVMQSVYSPGELIKTNVLGTINVIAAATRVGVTRVLVVSSDKAVEPTNLYGITKAAAESYAVQSNSYAYPQGTRVSCVRYGNVLGSRGSVVHVWRGQLERGEPLTVTHPAMTRFIITLPQAAAFCLAALREMEGGEIFVPLLPAATIDFLAQAVWCRDGSGGDRQREPVPMIVLTGLRPGGEKFHEALLSREEWRRAYWDGARVTILPSFHPWRAEWKPPPRSVPVSGPYTSDASGRWLSVADLVLMLEEVP